MTSNANCWLADEGIPLRVDWLRARNPPGASYCDEWARLLDGPFGTLLDVMQSRSERGRALRQESPFVDLVDQTARARLYRRVADEIDRMPRT